MKIKTEIKTGIVAIIIIVSSYWGFKFLKNESIFDSNYKYYALFDNVDGVASGSSITLNGLRIGKVGDMYFHSKNKILVLLNISKDIKLTNNSLAKIYSNSIIGKKNIHIEINKGQPLRNRDTIKTEINASLLEKMQSDIMPLKQKVDKMVSSIDSSMILVSEVLNKKNISNISNSIQNISKMTKNLADITNKIHLDSNLTNISTTISNLNKIVYDIRESKIKNTIQKINTSFSKIDSITKKINNNEGTLGKLIQNDSIYNNLNKSLEMLNELIEDIKINPKRYLHFSIFGRTPVYVKKKDDDTK